MFKAFGHRMCFLERGRRREGGWYAPRNSLGSLKSSHTIFFLLHIPLHILLYLYYPFINKSALLPRLIFHNRWTEFGSNRPKPVLKIRFITVFEKATGKTYHDMKQPQHEGKKIAVTFRVGLESSSDGKTRNGSKLYIRQVNLDHSVYSEYSFWFGCPESAFLTIVAALRFIFVVPLYALIQIWW